MAYVSGVQRDPTAVVGRRITAYVVDGLLGLLALVVVLSLVKHDTFRDAPGDACSILRARAADDNSSVLCARIAGRAWLWKRDDFLVAAYAAAIIGILDLVVLQALTGASLGKHALGLRVVDDQGQSAGFGRAIVRWLLLAVDGGIFLIGLIVMLSTRFHRRVGDLAAGTYVVGKASAGRPIGIAPMPVPYGGPVFAPPSPGPISLAAVPVEPAAPMAPGWGVEEPAAPPAIGSLWSNPPNTPGPSPPPARPTAAPAPAPAPPSSPIPAPSIPVPPPPAPWTPPAPAPQVPAAQAPPPAPPPPAPPRPTISQPAPQPAPERKLEPESWWDTAIPAEPADSEEQP